MTALTTDPTDDFDDELDGDDTAIELVVLDMAGTTVRDDGIVERAFAIAAERTSLIDLTPWDEALTYVRATMGQSKADVFTHLFAGDTTAAARATAEFEKAYGELISADGADEIPGAGAAIAALSGQGRTIALTTGFSPVTRDAILAHLEWAGEVDIALSPIDAGRGRPAPDLVLTAMLRAQVSSVDAVAVIGDTASDIQSGLRAGAGLVIGVASGAHTAEQLEAAGADAVIDDVTELPALLEHLGR